jgi:hypothetical protein
MYAHVDFSGRVGHALTENNLHGTIPLLLSDEYSHSNGHAALKR